MKCDVASHCQQAQAGQQVDLVRVSGHQGCCDTSHCNNSNRGELQHGPSFLKY